MSIVGAVARPVVQPVVKSVVGSDGSGFLPTDFSNLSAWLDAEENVSTSGSRTFTAADKAYFSIADNASLSTGDIDFTVGGWVYLDSKPTDQVNILAKDTTSPNREFVLYYQGSGAAGDRFGFTTFGSLTATILANSLGSPAAGRWYFVLAWHDATANTINIQVNDGTVDSLDATNSFPAGNSANFTVGARQFPSFEGYLGGRLSRLFLTKRVLTAAERTWLYNLGNGRSYGELGEASTDGSALLTSLVSYWQGNEGTASANMIDAHGTNHLVFTNTELLLNTGFETAGAGGADVFADWGEAPSGGSTVNDETVDVDVGAHACRLDVDASNSQVFVTQAVLTIGNIYNWSVRAKNGGSGTADVRIGNTGSQFISPTSSWATYSGTSAVASGNANFYLIRDSAASASLYFDSVSVKAAGCAPANGPQVATASDEIGTNHGVLTGYTATQQIESWTSDVPAAIGSGYALKFDGTDDYVVLPSELTRGLAKASLSVWVKLTNTPAPNAAIYYESTSSSGFTRFGLYVQSDRKLVVGARDTASGSLFTVTSATALTLGQWYHAAVVFDSVADTLTLYIDATQNGTPDTGPFGVLHDSASADVKAIGAYTPTPTSVPGLIDDARIYSSALSPAQVAELAAGNEATGATPVAHWTFDDGPQSSQISNGDPIVTLVGRSTNRVIATQATASARPAWIASGINSEPLLRLDGVDDFMSLVLADLASTAAFTLYIVCKFDNTTDAQFVLSGQNTKHLLQVASNVAKFQVDSGNTGEVAFTSTDPKLWTIRYDGAGAANADRLKVWLNGIAQTLSFTGTIPATTAAGSSVEIGRAFGAASYFNGDLAEQILYAPAVAHTDSERIKVQNFLTQEFGL